MINNEKFTNICSIIFMEGGIYMYTATVIANNILHRGRNDITPMKLQKLLYITYKEYLSATGKKLFNEPFETWRYGPVVRCVYDEFKPFGSQPITEYAKNAEGKAFMVAENTDQNLKMIIDNVFSKYGEYSGTQLSKLTHINDKSAWKEAVGKSCDILSDGDIVNEKSYLRR